MKTKTVTRVFIVEDHPIMRIGLKMMLEEKGFVICGEAASVNEAISLIPESLPDMAIFDLSLNGETAFPAVEQIRRLMPKSGLIVYSMHDAPMLIEKAMQICINAYVTKADPVETIVEAVHAVNAGKRFMSPSTLGLSVFHLNKQTCGISPRMPEKKKYETSLKNNLPEPNLFSTPVRLLRPFANVKQGTSSSPGIF